MIKIAKQDNHQRRTKSGYMESVSQPDTTMTVMNIFSLFPTQSISPNPTERFTRSQRLCAILFWPSARSLCIIVHGNEEMPHSFCLQSAYSFAWYFFFHFFVAWVCFKSSDLSWQCVFFLVLCVFVCGRMHICHRSKSVKQHLSDRSVVKANKYTWNGWRLISHRLRSCFIVVLLCVSWHGDGKVTAQQMIQAQREYYRLPSTRYSKWRLNLLWVSQGISYSYSRSRALDPSNYSYRADDEGNISIWDVAFPSLCIYSVNEWILTIVHVFSSIGISTRTTRMNNKIREAVKSKATCNHTF